MGQDGDYPSDFDKFRDDSPYRPPQTYHEQPVHKVPMPNNHLTAAILATLFCCLPFGVVAIVMASQVNGAYMIGNYAEAERLSKSASTWTIASVVSGMVVGLVYIMLMVASGL